MSGKIRENLCLLNVISECDAVLFSLILKYSKKSYPSLINSITECFFNIAHLNLPLSNLEKKNLRKKIQVVSLLADIKINNSEKLGVIQRNRTIVQFALRLSLQYLKKTRNDKPAEEVLPI